MACHLNSWDSSTQYAPRYYSSISLNPMKEEITVPINWLKGLIDCAERVDSTKDKVTREGNIAHLLGYVESTRFLIKLK